MNYWGELTEAVQTAIAQLCEPGEEFLVADLAGIVVAHHQATGETRAICATDQVNKVVYSLSVRSDDCLTNMGWGRYRFNGFGLDPRTGKVHSSRLPDRGVCPVCHMVIPSSGVCGVCE